MERKKNHKLIRLVIIVLLCAVLISFLAGLIYYCSIRGDLVELDENRLITVGSISFTVYGIDDTPLNESVPLKNMKRVRVGSLGENTKNAFIAIEDKRFYKHRGVDTVRICGAFIKNIKSGNLKEGASTITQQLIKNTFLTNEKSLKRKINEIKLARDLEKKFSKEEILEMYLNTIYFGNNAYGIEAASRVYFNSCAEGLTLSQSALLAGIIKSPGKYAPTSDVEACTARRNTVLKCMLNQNLISKDSYRQAVSELIDTDLVNRDIYFKKNYMYAAIQEACDILKISESLLSTSGVKIYTYCDDLKQEAIERSIFNATARTVCGSIPESCAVIVNNKTKGVEGFCGYSRGNLYTQKRQPGSTAKPIAVYAPAIERGLVSPASPILDEPVNFNGYRPRNYQERYYGWTTVRNAVSKSMNSASVKTLNELGIANSCEYLQKNGIATENESLSLALGSFSRGVTVLSLNDAYVTLGSEGSYARSAFVRKIEDKEGNLLYEHKIKEKPVFSPKTSYIMTNILFSVIKDGTGKELNELPYEIAAKSGTCGEASSTDNTDAYFISYTSEHTLTVWLGASTGNLPAKISGGTVPAQISKDIYKSVYADKHPKCFLKPNGVKLCKLDRVLLEQENKLALANDSTPDSETLLEIFADDNCPKNASKRNLKPREIKFFLKTKDNMSQIVIDNCEEGTVYEVHRIKSGKDEPVCRLSAKDKSYVDKNSGFGAVAYYIVPVNEKNLVRGERSGIKSIFICEPSDDPPATGGEKPAKSEDEITKDDTFMRRVKRLLGVKNNR